jgi:hypothetical protein
MTKGAGVGVVIVLVVALLAREACVIGAVRAGAGARRALDVAIVLLAVLFVTVVTVQLAGLSS